MPNVIRSVHLDLKAIRIKEFEGFLRLGVGKFEVHFLQPGAHCVSIEVFNPEVVMIHGWGLARALLDAKERISDAQDMHGCRLLPDGHPEELLVEP